MYREAIDTLYSTKEDCLVIGLTGRTGAGCSTAAKIMQSKKEDLEFEYSEMSEWKKDDKYKFEIIRDYIYQGNRWVPFEIIEVSSVILSCVLSCTKNKKSPIENLTSFLDEIQNKEQQLIFKLVNSKELKKQIEGLREISIEAQKFSLDIKELPKGETLKEYYNFYIKKMPEYKRIVKAIFQNYSCYEIEKSKLQDQKQTTYHLYTYLMQRWGNNLRASGDPYETKLNQKEYYALAKKIGVLIDIIREYKKDNKIRICIDAIRNANESNYFKSKYRGYYLVSISVDESERTKRLQNLNANEQQNIDNVEYPKKYKPEDFFYHQNIAQCFEIADIHIYNKDVGTMKKFFLTWQLLKYITLMIHPGLVTPTHMERCMQLAFNAKYNSGCLSRQVGAVVTGADFSVKSVGWNDVPKGHMPCNLRDVKAYCKGNETACYSDFECNDDEFKRAMQNINNVIIENGLQEQRFPYCFKDIHNGYTDAKNQVFTRALHAEENAFLQISKYGGQGVQDGYLFCTASPCELCSKKAYQLGIRNIYYIDPYPGIAEKHIIRVGENKNRPKMNLFYGAIGEAYISLYRPLLPYKDELELLSGIDFKKVAKEGEQYGKTEPKYSDLLYKKVDFKINFNSREEIESTRSVDILVEDGEFFGLDRRLTWTGSAYFGTELLDSDYELSEYGDKGSPYRYYIDFKGLKKKGDRIKYTVRSKVRDEGHLMHEYFSHYIKHPTNKLHLEVEVPQGLIDEVQFQLYADKEMEMPYKDKKCKIVVKTELGEGGKEKYFIDVNCPNLFYTYSLEWFFKEGNILNNIESTGE